MTRTVLIDGRSGAGKTTLARWLAERTGFQLIHLDDLYPDWTGLRAAGEIVARDVLAPTAAGYYRWDWEQHQPGTWRSVDAAAPMIVEGCGAITPATVAAARARGLVATLFLDGDPALRKDRALRRDPDYAAFWEMWAAQEDEHIRSVIPWRDVDFSLTWPPNTPAQG
ncbi:hypothetical protein CCICO_04050 [Corynebacterium ciconiae DSM 44920]|uniref:hypothetical protein n=1 Tax=Corynebacterium ciconiae TaxID=227319 RepID=UPI00036FBECF|nr:hypothetical protein [Corynebacterium ciconiae]WKD60847.1 hypothetical protein CCICO_04050 [Corynebacterium ciconiae DSM 44920]